MKNPAYLLLLFCLCAVQTTALPVLVPYFDGSKWGYADSTGHIVIEPQWDEAQFFTDGRAIVKYRTADKPRLEYISCLVDTKGHYIIDSSLHWTGQYYGWGATPLNASRNGLWGLVDTNGQVQIPFEWEQTNNGAHIGDSLKVVQRNGLQGVIDRSNKLVIPCKYGAVGADQSLAQHGLFLVWDADNMKGLNKAGLIDVNGNRILSMRYKDVRLMETDDDRTVIYTTRNLYNEPPGSNVQNPGTVEWFSLAGQPIAPAAPKQNTNGNQEWQEPGGYISFGHYSQRGLMNAKRKVLIPCCTVKKVTPDTIYTETQVQHGDTLEITRGHLHTATLKPYGPPEKKYVYNYIENYFNRSYTCGNGVRAAAEYRQYQASLPRITIEGRQVLNFFKDSMLYGITGGTSRGPHPYYVVAGGPRQNYRTHYAVVDSNANYLLGPMLQNITHYDPLTGMATLSGYFDTCYGSVVRTPEGKILFTCTGYELSGAMEWKGKRYAHINIEKYTRQRDGTYGKTKFTTLVDENGKRVAALADYNIIEMNSNTNAIVPLPQGGLVVTDSMYRMGFVYPDGTLIYPEISFKYNNIVTVADNWYKVNDYTTREQNIVDIRNRDIVPGIAVGSVAPVERPLYPYNSYYRGHQDTVRGLYQVSGSVRSSGQAVSFYMTKDGLTYYKKPAMKKP